MTYLAHLLKRLFQENFNTIFYEKSQKLLKNSIIFFFFINFFKKNKQKNKKRKKEKRYKTVGECEMRLFRKIKSTSIGGINTP